MKGTWIFSEKESRALNFVKPKTNRSLDRTIYKISMLLVQNPRPPVTFKSEIEKKNIN